MSDAPPEDRANGRERLLDAAHVLFAEKGFSDVSINEIASAAGMTRAAPYYHFKNKEELYAAVLVRQISAFLSLVEEKMRAAVSFHDQLHAVIEVAIMAHGSSFGRSKEDFQTHVSADMQAEVKSRLGDPMDVFIPIFRKAHDAEAFSRVDPTTACRIFFMMLIGYMEMVAKIDECSAGPFSLAGPSADAFIDVFLNGI